MTPALATVWENTAYTPVAGTPYQSISMLRARPENPTFDKFVRELGLFQVSLFYPVDKGSKDAETRAELIKVTFYKNLLASLSGINVTIYGTPHVLPGMRDGDRWMVPVRIPYYSNIS
jgi:hypothetical protein